MPADQGATLQAPRRARQAAIGRTGKRGSARRLFNINDPAGDRGAARPRRACCQRHGQQTPERPASGPARPALPAWVTGDRRRRWVCAGPSRACPRQRPL